MHLQRHVQFFMDAGMEPEYDGMATSGPAHAGQKRTRAHRSACSQHATMADSYEFASHSGRRTGVRRDHLPGGQPRSLLALARSKLAHPIYCVAMPVVPAGRGQVPIGSLSTLEEVVQVQAGGTRWWMYIQEFKAEVR